jgi:hypothetical protein
MGKGNQRHAPASLPSRKDPVAIVEETSREDRSLFT